MVVAVFKDVFGARDAPDAEAHANKAVADEVE